MAEEWRREHKVKERKQSRIIPGFREVKQIADFRGRK